MQARCSLVKHPDFGLKKCVHKFFSQGSCASQPTKITSAMSPVIQNICVALPFPCAGMWLKRSSNGKACASNAPKYLFAAICKLFFRDVCRVVLGASNDPHHSDQLPCTVSLTKSYLLECVEYYWSIFDVFIHFLTSNPKNSVVHPWDPGSKPTVDIFYVCSCKTIYQEKVVYGLAKRFRYEVHFWFKKASSHGLTWLDLACVNERSLVQSRQ